MYRQDENAVASPCQAVSEDLLQRAADRQSGAWTSLVARFRPTIKAWCWRRGIADHDASDVCQDVLAAAALGMPKFRQRDAGGAFVRWLQTIAQRKIADFFVRGPKLKLGDDCSVDWLDRAAAAMPGIGEEPQNEEALLRGVSGEITPDGSPRRVGETRMQIEALLRVRQRLRPRTWNVFCRLVCDQCRPEIVAQEFAMTLGAVYLARSRVVRAVREEFERLETTLTA